MVRAPQQAQYWTPSVYSQMFQADEDEAAKVLKNVVEHLSDVKSNIQKPTDELKKKFSWSSVAETLISYCE
jgi:hypothetical protein